MLRRKTDARQVDSKGRLTLGERFANHMVLVRQVDPTELVITLARVVPEREAWLHENPKAKAAVLRGIQEAKRKEFSTRPPDLEADEKLIDKMEDGGR